MPDSTKQPFLVGLTGGIASGKSLVSGLFTELGVKIIDTDLLARKLVEPGSPGLGAIIETFGRDIINEQGQLKRDQLSQLIFADPSARAHLETILHPLIRRQMLEQIATFNTEPYLILVIPLLQETGQQTLVDRVLLVDCPVEEQQQRLMQRNQIDSNRAKAMIAAQANRVQRSAIAHDIIHNTSPADSDTLPSQVARLHRQYLDMAAKIKEAADR